ncbi:MAG: hypothetical protein ABDH91_01460 [Bacteroidia bacterium]
MLRKTAASISALSCLTFWACSGRQKVLDHTFPQHLWVYPDTIWQTFEVSAIQPCRKVELQIELEETYPWRNMYVLFFFQPPNQPPTKARFHLVFADSLGYWYKKNRRFAQIIIPQLALPYTGLYRIGLLPYIRQDTMIGIRRARLYLLPCSE